MKVLLDENLDYRPRKHLGSHATVSESKRWLKKQGCTFRTDKKHEKVQLGDKESVLPRHPSQELAAGTANVIKRQLGPKE